MMFTLFYLKCSLFIMITENYIVVSVLLKVMINDVHYVVFSFQF